MTSALLAALAAIVGIAIGRLWDVRAESARWRRDQKTACYQRVVEQFQALYENIRAATLADGHDGTFEALAARTRTNDFAPWDSAVAAVWLHGSADVVEAVTELDEAVGQLLYAVVEQQIATVSEWNGVRRPARLAFERFVRAAREELDLPPVPVQIFTNPPSGGPYDPDQVPSGEQG
ncbi:hypothetical protein ACFRAQ_32805 [Nocardia sp. NPDC056611]|uniref:hypothetical protein n=1 Tax=Nocardia sp. NPDC056611 TaxID=3345877 RepID=UPI00366C88B8